MTPRQKSLEAAARRTVTALRRHERLESVDELAIANVLFTSHQLDHLDPLASPAMVASLVRAHLAASKALLGGPDEQTSNEDDALADFLAYLRSPEALRGDASGYASGYRLPDRPPGWTGD
jgi:hypothetical protein